MQRFDELKKDPVKFAIPWFLQVVWIYLTALPVWIILGNAGSLSRKDLFWADIVGIIIWVFGFTVEVIADTQKFIFKEKNPRDFISTGIWQYSRYANYNGEITLWIGMFILCTGGFVEAWQWVSIISPLFVAFLITRVSGIPLLEASSEKRYGERQGAFFQCFLSISVHCTNHIDTQITKTTRRERQSFSFGFPRNYPFLEVSRISLNLNLRRASLSVDFLIAIAMISIHQLFLNACLLLLYIKQEFLAFLK